MHSRVELSNKNNSNVRPRGIETLKTSACDTAQAVRLNGKNRVYCIKHDIVIITKCSYLG